MLIEADASDFAVSLAGRASARFIPVPDSVLAPLEELQMLADLAVSIRPNFAPCAWTIVECNEIVGLLSVV